MLDGKDERGSLYEERKGQKLEVSSESNILIDIEETSWRQEFKALWLKERDKCTKFFHRMTNSNRRVNSISSLEVDGELLEDPENIYEEIVSFYSSLYNEPFSWRPFLDDLTFDSIFRVEAAWLERPFNDEEVAEVVWSLNRDKASGPNRFTLAFFQSC